MTADTQCELCGEPMPEGEQMFKYHGYSGDCPKPPLAKTTVFVEYIQRDTRDGEYWLDITVSGQPYHQLQFASATERQRAVDDMLEMVRQHGGIDCPKAAQ
jgi:hypothetical protein